MISLSMSCFPQKGKWKKAQKINTIESYQEFLNNYPGSEFYDEAKNKLIESEFRKAESINSIDGYTEYLGKYENSPYTEQAENKLMELEFGKAERINTIKSYNRYLEKYPAGELAENARKSIESLEFERTRELNNIKACNEYLKKYPEGTFKDEAEKLLEELEYQYVIEKDSIGLYEEFIGKYPEGENTDIVKEKLASLILERSAWEKFVNQPTLKSYSLFKTDYPDSKMNITFDILNRISKNAKKNGNYYGNSSKKITFKIDLSGDTNYLVLTSGTNEIIRNGVRIYTRPGNSGYKTYDDSSFDIEFISNSEDPLVIDIIHIKYDLTLEYFAGKGYVIIETKKETKIWDLN